MISVEDAKSKLANYWKIKDWQFLAVFNKTKTKESSGAVDGIFQLKSNDKVLIYPKLEGCSFPRDVKIPHTTYERLVDGRAYMVDVDIIDNKIRTKSQNPFLLQIKATHNIIQSTEVITPKKFINDWFGRKGENPDDAASIAGQLRLNQLELYTQTKRFIFELIQNADDMPFNEKEVAIDIHLLDNFFLFKHNGQYFRRDDVMAICDAAKSTKRTDTSKTGYKGIGFKSVFSDSEKVFIISQDYSFKFDKSATIYSDFKTLYKPYWSKLIESEQKRFFDEYIGKEKELLNIDNIPWQIKPIWTEFEALPDEIRNHFFKQNNVNIGLEVGASKIQEKKYDLMIQGLIDDPRFLLFLRNTKTINYYPPSGISTSIKISKDKSIIKLYANDIPVSTYSIFEPLIQINNTAFSRAGLNFERIKLADDQYVFKDKNGNLLNNIPEKLGRLELTTLTFAAKIRDGEIENILASESVLYNYLPTSDQRFKFPFIINGDFISKTDREGILSENIWNHYLFFNIGFELVKWLMRLSRNILFLNSYLNVLPDKLLDEAHEELNAINYAFNKGLTEAISSTKFIPDNAQENKLNELLMIDDTGLAEIINEKPFLSFITSGKVLVNNKLNKKKLKIEYLNIEVFGFKELRLALKDPVKLTKLNHYLQRLGTIRTTRFLEWLNRAAEKNLSFDDIKDIAFVNVHEQRCEFISISDLTLKKDCFLTSISVKSIEKYLKKSGARISTFLINEYENLHELFVKNGNTYLSVPGSEYERLTEQFTSKLSEFDLQERIDLLNALKNVPGIDIGTIAKLPWFRNNIGEFKLLNELINSDGFRYSSYFDGYFIHSQERELLGNEYVARLKKFEEILEIKNFFITVSSAETYTSNNEVIIFLTILLKRATLNKNIYQNIASKILLNGQAIGGDLYQDKVYINITDGNNETYEEKFYLKDLLPNINEGSKNVSILLEMLQNLHPEYLNLLRTEVFALKAINVEDIEKGIRTQDSQLSYKQFLYITIAQWFSSNPAKVIKLDSSNPLTMASSDENPVELFHFLDFMFEKKVVNKGFSLEYRGRPYDLIPNGKIICDEEHLVFENERLPQYLRKWMEGNYEKKEFLVEKGALSRNYNHILFRKAIQEQDQIGLEEATLKLENNMNHFINTAMFLENQQNNEGQAFHWCKDAVIDFYNKFSTIQGIDFSQHSFPTYTENNFENIKLERLNKEKVYYSVQLSWDEYREAITGHISANNNHYIPKNLLLPIGYKIVSLNISEVVNQQRLRDGAMRFDSDYYLNWPKFKEQIIYTYKGSFIPYHILFDDTPITDSHIQDKTFWEDKMEYFVCQESVNEIPFCFKNMNHFDAMSLCKARFMSNASKSKSENSDELTQDEILELETLFNRELSASELSSYWLLAYLKALKHYRSIGYDTSYAEQHFDDCITKRMLQKVFFDGKQYNILPRSAKENLLRISVSAWNSLRDPLTQLFVVSSGNIHQTIIGHDDLINNSDSLLFTIASDNKKEKSEIISNLFDQESISDLQYNDSIQVTLLIRLSGESQFKNLFVGFNNKSDLNDF